MSFGGVRRDYFRPERSKIIIVPVPFDKTSTWIKGADKGPAAIIEASQNMELYDIETDSEVFQRGIHTTGLVTDITTPEQLVKSVHEELDFYLKRDKFIVTIGGNHSVSIGAFKAFADHFGELTILQLDAHTDLRPKYEGSELNHACVMTQAKKMCPVVQVGIRSMSAEEKEFVDRKRVVFAHEMIGKRAWKKKALDSLTSNVYITLDLDVFDPSIMPSTGTPEPGGLAYYDVLNFLAEVNKSYNIVGFDVVELCPNKQNKSPDFLAAKLIYQILSMRFSKKDI